MSDRFAKAITLGLARLTFASLHRFEKLGVNMADIDQAIADWTDYARGLSDAKDTAVAALEDVQHQLQVAQDNIQNLNDTDAATDTEQINAAVANANAAAATKLEEALTALRDAPVAPDVPPEQPAQPVVSDNPTPGLTGDVDNLNPGVPGDQPNEIPAEVPVDPPLPADAGVPAGVPSEEVPPPADSGDASPKATKKDTKKDTKKGTKR